MRILQFINWLLVAMAATLAVTLGVVCLLFYIYRHEPIMQSSFPELLRQTTMFWGFLMVSGTAALTLHFRKTGYWLVQVVMVLCLSGVISYYIPD